MHNGNLYANLRTSLTTNAETNASMHQHLISIAEIKSSLDYLVRKEQEREEFQEIMPDNITIKQAIAMGLTVSLFAGTLTTILTWIISWKNCYFKFVCFSLKKKINNKIYFLFKKISINGKLPKCEKKVSREFDRD